jgi:hypothetical protein|tara:strand:- start:354 stop:1046 length:693 start_codon:yes stop_codon:yes gene_type:complete
MATTKITDLLDRASIILQDNTKVRYPSQELLNFFNDAQLEVLLHRPDANTVSQTLALVNGSKQSVPTSALRLIEVIRNTGGRAVTQVQRRILDETLPDWHETAAGANKIEHYIYDPADPKNFYVYPKAISGTHSLEIILSSATTAVVITDAEFAAGTNVVISIDDIYANALLDYILYRCYQKDSEYTGNEQRSMMHYQGFSNALGIKTQTDAAITPQPEGMGRQRRGSPQ